jgi:hypothetical protein
MTMREVLNGRLRRVTSIFFTAFAVFGASIVAAGVCAFPEALALGVPAFFVAFLTMFYAHFGGIKCPRCGGRLAQLIMQHGMFSVHQRLQFCPYCGTQFDEEIREGSGRHTVDDGVVRHRG